MKNGRALNKIYSNIDELIDNYADLPETREADNRFWEYARKNILQGSRDVKESDLETALYDVEYFNEKQGFIYGFNYAIELMGKPDLLDTVAGEAAGGISKRGVESPK